MWRKGGREARKLKKERRDEGERERGLRVMRLVTWRGVREGRMRLRVGL